MVVTTNVQGPWMVAVGDLDNDGHLDVVSASQTDNKIAWYKNTGKCCPPGTNTLDKGTSCHLCRPGFFASAINEQTCFGCSKGKYSSEFGLMSNDQCKGRCPAGTFSSESGQATSATCSGRCSAGRYSNEVGRDSNEQCKVCRAGTFSSETGQTTSDTCQRCNAHYYSSETGSNSCTRCPSGWDNTVSASIACSDIRHDPGCSQGKFSFKKPAISIYCTNCSAGAFSAMAGQVYFCNGKCSRGKYSLQTGLISSDECTKCPIGFYSEKEGASTDTCEVCPSGYDNTAMGSGRCEATHVVFQISLVDCIAIFCGAVLFIVVAFVFYRCRMRQRDEESETQLTQMNQTLLRAADVQLQKATNPLEQSQFNIPSFDLQLGERIGVGGNGWIYEATMGANTVVAAKEIMSTTIDPNDMLEFEHEAKMLTQMNHPQVLRVFGFCIKRAEENIDDQERRYIVTEFAPNGSLEEIIVRAAKIAPMLISESKYNGRIKMPFNKMKALEWAVQIASGTAFLHRKGYVHRDMKPQNVLLNKSNDALVADLGTVRRPPSGLYPNDKVVQSTTTTTEKANNIDIFLNFVDEEQGHAITCTTNTIHGMTSMRGTPLYMAPEQFEDPNYSYPVDVWAYGLTLVRLFTLKWPYPLETGLRDLVMGIARGALRPEEVKLEEVPHEEVLHVINACLEIDASKRPTMREVERRLTEVLKKLLKEEAACRKSEREKERRRIKDIKKERRIKRRAEREREIRTSEED